MMHNQPDEAMVVQSEKDSIIDFLTDDDSVFFKNQQRGESDLIKSEKFQIALEVFDKSKLNFLMRFGKHLKKTHLNYFKQFTNDSKEGYEMDLILKDLLRTISEKAHHVDIRNRRYEALQKLISDDSYFSEIEMMKRNPLLYEQLVGQYLSVDEKRERDKYKLDENATFVKILMEGIERDDAALAKQEQEDNEDEMMGEEEYSDEDDRNSSSPEPSSSRWGEFEAVKQKRRRKSKLKTTKISPQEQILLKEEFISSMYQSFLDGKDEDFNYESVDNNPSYDNVEEIEQDEEEKYFDSEEPRTLDLVDNPSSEDELDIFMSAINQNPAINHLSREMQKL